MGLCVSRPAVMLERDSEGYLTQTTYVNPSKEVKQAARTQRKELIAELGRRAVNEIEPEAYATVIRYR